MSAARSALILLLCICPAMALAAESAASATAATPASTPPSTAPSTATGAAGNPTGMTIAQITQCSRSNIPAETAVMNVQLTAYGREGNSHELKARLYLQRQADGLTRAMLQLHYPPDLRGSSYLVLEKAQGDNATYVYLPDVQRTRKLALDKNATTLWTTDFSYEDITQLQGLTGKGTATRLPDTTEQGRAVYVLSIKADPKEASSYESVTSFVDQQTCVPLRTEFYGFGHKLRKVMSVDAKSIRQQDNYWQPGSIDMRDVVAGTHTTLVISDLHYDQKVAKSVFNPMSFYRSNDR